MKSLIRLARVCLRKYVGIGFQPEIQPEILCRSYNDYTHRIYSYFTEYGIPAWGNELIRKFLYKIKHRKFLTTIKHTSYNSWTWGSKWDRQEIEYEVTKQVRNTIKGVEDIWEERKNTKTEN